MFDVAIIGAGPSGTAAAYSLLSRGLSVLILDRPGFPGKKACAGGITPKCYRLFQYDIQPVIQQVCHAITFTGPGRSRFVVRHRLPLCYMTDRKDLDAFSLKKVVQSGARFAIIRKIFTITETPTHIEIQADSQLFSARFLIGADGANSRVRRLFFPHLTVEKQFAIEADLYLKNSRTPQMLFDFSAHPGGYGWVFGKKDHVNVGLYGMGSSPGFRAENLDAFARRVLGQSIVPETIKGYPICTSRSEDSVAFGRVILAGDAAGLAEPLLGEGLSFAVKSGQLAADAICDTQVTGLPLYFLYERSLKALRKDLKLYDHLSRWVYQSPWAALRLLSLPVVHQRFAGGFAKGACLSDILSLRRLTP